MTMDLITNMAAKRLTGGQRLEQGMLEKGTIMAGATQSRMVQDYITP